MKTAPTVTHTPPDSPIYKDATTADVAAAVNDARAHGLGVSVRGGGNDGAGRALVHNALVIDVANVT